MKKLAFALTALGLLAAAPASAQEFRLRAGPDGVTVRGGDDDRYDRRRGIERRVYRDGPRSYRRGGDECRTITTRRERPNGTVVVSRERRCI